ncbi:hypothetical protein BDV12DRAFT_182136 [Aspergillus spectabilis]
MPSSKHQRRQQKRQRFHPPPLFWDKLTRLTPLIAPHTFAPDFLRNCSAACLQDIKKLSCCGGPYLSGIRNYKSRTTDTTESTQKTGGTTVYHLHFEDHIINHDVYPPLTFYPDGTETAESDYYEEIQGRLQLRRPAPALSTSTLKKNLAEFRRINKNATEEQLVIKDILLILEGRQKVNLAPLTDGTLADAKPDFFYGATPNQLNPAIRKQLNKQIIPSEKSNCPMAPNSFVETKGHDRSIPVATHQACYEGALGTRAMHSLQQFGTTGNNNTPVYYDNNAYTMTSTYHSGILGLYTTHPTSPEAYRQGIAAYRNARDPAEEQRNRFIKLANERYAASERVDATDSIDEEQQMLSDDNEEVIE